MCPRADGGTVVGSVQKTPGGVYETLVVGLRTDGTVAWRDCVGGTGNRFGRDLTRGADGEVTTVGLARTHYGRATFSRTYATDGSVRRHASLGNGVDPRAVAAEPNGHVVVGTRDAANGPSTGWLT